MARSGITLGWQADELALQTGMVTGMAKKVSTQGYLSDVLSYTHKKMSEEFDNFVDLARGGQDGKGSLHHVYEWRMPIKAPHAKLWKHQLVGHGASKLASWDWRASKKRIDNPQEKAMDPDDPMYHLEEEDVERFSSRTYFFHWKAPVMEGDFTTIIQPVNVKKIMYASPVDLGELVWSKESVVENPGGDQTTGAFTALWVTWWKTEAPRVFDSILRPELDRDIENSVRMKSRRRSGTLGITSVTDFKTLQEQGEDWARINIDRYQRKYRNKT